MEQSESEFLFIWNLLWILILILVSSVCIHLPSFKVQMDDIWRGRYCSVSNRFGPYISWNSKGESLKVILMLSYHYVSLTSALDLCFTLTLFIYLFNKIVSSAWPSTLLYRSILWLILICPVSIYTCFALISIHIFLICISPLLCFLKCRNLALACTSSTDLNGLSLIMRALHILIFQFLYMILLVCHWLFYSLQVWPGLVWSVEFII